MAETTLAVDDRAQTELVVKQFAIFAVVAQHNLARYPPFNRTTDAVKLNLLRIVTLKKAAVAAHHFAGGIACNGAKGGVDINNRLVRLLHIDDRDPVGHRIHRLFKQAQAGMVLTPLGLVLGNANIATDLARMIPQGRCGGMQPAALSLGRQLPTFFDKSSLGEGRRCLFSVQTLERLLERRGGTVAKDGGCALVPGQDSSLGIELVDGIVENATENLLPEVSAPGFGSRGLGSGLLA